MKMLTDDVEVGGLGLGLGRVDLAEVAPAVGLLDVAQVQVPRAVVLVRHLDTWVARDHVIVHRQNGRPLEMDPRHLLQYQLSSHTHEKYK